MHRRRRHAAGFTLIESICAMVVLGAVGLGASGLIARVTDTFQAAATDGELAAELGAALDRVERALREIPGKTGGSAALESLTPASIGWTVGGAPWSLALANGELRLTGDAADPAVLARDVTALDVAAFDQSNDALAGTLSGGGLDAVRRVQVRVTAERQGRSVTLRTRVFLRACVEGAP